MCGIFGFTQSFPQADAVLRRMGDRIQHRGPDGEAYYSGGGLSMGMRRLSIIDVENGTQPFFDASRDIVVMCNGEVFNFRELRSELMQDGVCFRSDSDIEVIPHLYAKYGLEFVSKLNGMYAIALFDQPAKTLYLIRDRLGVKPLYFSMVGDHLLYASEIKALVEHPEFDRSLDFDALSSYLDLRYIPRPGTPFSSVRKLDSASILKWTQGEVEVSRYWNLSLDPQDVVADEKTAIDELDHLVKDSIGLQLTSDVPIGSFLSGGVDSSIVTSLASDLTPKDFSVFHVSWTGFENKVNETPAALKVLGNRPVRKFFSEAGRLAPVKLIPKLIYHLDEPFADAAFLPTYHLSKVAAENVKVILSGAGGDELFGGYPHHMPYSRLRSAVNGALGRKALAHSYYDMCRNSYQKEWARLFPWYTKGAFKREFESTWREYEEVDSSNAVMLNDIQYYLQDDILFLTDKMSMAASIETRVPLLDHRLVEFAQRVPSTLKLHQMESKYVLKKWAERYVPQEALYRKKEGFGYPIEGWVGEHKDLYLDPLLEGGYLLSSGLLSRRRLDRFLFSATLTADECWQYWQIAVLEIWARMFLCGVAPEDVFEIE
ncbi:asparagine synthase (glutamine-hydrolyzing) [Rhodothermus sp. AH-315-K08]|nr:asparagine synthase (glutamine-hydrolyzing) [Rhodothermus sp. AH-315-K08]